MDSQLAKLQIKVNRQKTLYKKMRIAYPEIARECRHNIMKIQKQMRLLKQVTR